MSDGISLIEISFPVPVSPTSDQLRAVTEAIDAICADYEAENPDRVMWTMGFGGKPSCIWDDNCIYDMSVYQIEVAERERFDSEKSA